MKKFWLSVAHFAIMGAGLAASIYFPGFAPLIVPLVGAANGSLPSPFTSVTQHAPPTVEQAQAQAQEKKGT